MNTINRQKDILTALTLAIIALSALMAGCSGDSFSTNAAAPVTPFGSPTPSPTGVGCVASTSVATSTLPDVSGGSTVTLNITSQTQLDNYLGWTTYAPTNFAVNISLQQDGQVQDGSTSNYGYGGSVVVGFTDNGSGTTVQYEDSFSSLLQTCDTGSNCNTVSSQAENDEYSLESTKYPGYPSGAFHGFYQGTTYCNGEAMPPGNVCFGDVFGGAVIIVLNNTQGAVDSCGNATAEGSVWYKNFVNSGDPAAPVPGTSCWFLSAGPYQCREWLDGSVINTLEDLLPNGTGGYQELGTFTGLDMSQAFNGTWQTL